MPDLWLSKKSRELLKIPLRHSITVSERGEMCAWEDRKEEEEEEGKKTEVYKQHVCYRGHDYRASHYLFTNIAGAH